MAKAPRLRPEDVNRVGTAVLRLAQELWVVKDRQRILERILDDHGIDASDAIARHQPDDVLRAELDAERQAYVDGILSALVDGR